MIGMILWALFWLFIIGGIIGLAVKVLQYFDDKKSKRDWDKQMQEIGVRPKPPKPRFFIAKFLLGESDEERNFRVNEEMNETRRLWAKTQV